MGSFSTTASPRPSTFLPEGSVATGFRTTVVRDPVRTPFASVSALWLVIGRTAGVFFKQRPESSLASGNNCQIVATCIRFYIGYSCFSDHQFAASPLKFRHPARHLDSLIHCLRIGIKPRRPINRFPALRMRNAEPDTLYFGAFLFPKIQIEVAFRLQRRVEHALARHHPPRADLVARTVR